MKKIILGFALGSFFTLSLAFAYHWNVTQERIDDLAQDSVTESITNAGQIEYGDSSGVRKRIHEHLMSSQIDQVLEDGLVSQKVKDEIKSQLEGYRNRYSSDLTNQVVEQDVAPNH